MNISRPRWGLAYRVVLLCCAYFLLTPLTSHAATRLVDQAHTDTGNCEIIACQTIQYAINQSVNGDTISIGSGTYRERVTVSNKQLTIRGASKATTRITMPLGVSTYLPSEAPYDFAIMRVSNGSTVDISDLTISGPNPGGERCSSNGNSGDAARLDFGLLVEDASQANVHGIGLTDIREDNGATIISGCLTGHAVRYREGSTGAFYNNTVDRYMRTGISTQGIGTDVEIHHNAFTGIGPTSQAAQNSVSIASLSKAHVHHNTIQANRYIPTSTNSSGIILSNADDGSVVENNTIDDTDLGIALQSSTTGGGRVQNNETGPNIRIGIYVGSTAGPNARVIDNNIHGANKGLWVGSNTSAQIFTNMIHNNLRGVSIEGRANTTAILTSNNIIGNGVGIYFRETAAEQIGTTVAHNRIFSNTLGADYEGTNSFTSQLENNWWGCNEGPNQTGCDSASVLKIDTGPWLILTAQADVSNVYNGIQIPVTIHTHINSDNVNVSQMGYIPDLLPLSFSATGAVPDVLMGATTNGDDSYSALVDMNAINGSLMGTLDNATAILHFVVVDVCTNIVGPQNIIPAGYFVIASDCYEDQCTNIIGGQQTVPQGYFQIGLDCYMDQCANIIDGQQTVPLGYFQIGLDCHLDQCANIIGDQQNVPQGYFQISLDCYMDQCANVTGSQQTVPQGYFTVGSLCYVDQCANIAGDQQTVPSDHAQNGLICLKDLCDNIDQIQTSIPFGFVQTSISCLKDECTNITGLQSQVPAGQNQKGTQCTQNDCVAKVLPNSQAVACLNLDPCITAACQDMCKNIAGVQTEEPLGYIQEGNVCTKISGVAKPVPDTDGSLPFTGLDLEHLFFVALGLIAIGFILHARRK